MTGQPSRREAADPLPMQADEARSPEPPSIRPNPGLTNGRGGEGDSEALALLRLLASQSTRRVRSETSHESERPDLLLNPGPAR